LIGTQLLADFIEKELVLGFSIFAKYAYKRWITGSQCRLRSWCKGCPLAHSRYKKPHYSEPLPQAVTKV
jgi:hypothetical protein